MSNLFTRSATIMGRITAIRWKSDDGTRCIAVAVDEHTKKQITVIGELPNPVVGQLYEFEGDIGRNERFRSDEIKLRSFRTVIPSDTHGIQRYIVDTAKWAGPAVAKCLTDAFGQDALNVIKTDPDKVAATVSGITIERAREMQKSLIENEKHERAAVEVAQLLGASMPAGVARRAVKQWGCKAADIIKRNPFRLTELPRVGFAGADAVWRAMGLPIAHPKRQAAAILHTIEEAHTLSGDTWIEEQQLLTLAEQRVGQIDPGILPKLERIGRIVQVAPKQWAEVGIHNDELYVASCFRDAKPDDEQPIKVPTDGLAPDQIKAAELFAKWPTMILTGGPGTGKTYTTARLIQALQGRSILLCAPTGKAAKQMTNALRDTCGLAARTIHRCLGPSMDEETGEFHFTHGENQKLNVAAVVIDEFSMVDVRLARALFSALPNNCRVLIVGDRHQLPSVGPGSLLRDMIAAGVPSCELTEIKRNQGRIVAACHEVKAGKVPEPSPRLCIETGENWRHLESEEPQSIKNIIEALYRDKLPAMGFTDPKWSIQCIAPMNERGALSCLALNELIQSILNSNRTPVTGLPFSVGDKVVRLKNGDVAGEYVEEDELDEADIEAMKESKDGTIPVVNGDLGIVEKIDDKHITVRFSLPERVARITRKAHELRLAYCMTCHKLQGSEAPVVILPMHRQLSSSPLWNREWIYTAMSRAKTALITVGQISAMTPGVLRIGNAKRRTMLESMIKEEAKSNRRKDAGEAASPDDTQQPQESTEGSENESCQ